jgi:hypothetical protein
MLQLVVTERQLLKKMYQLRMLMTADHLEANLLYDFLLFIYEAKIRRISAKVQKLAMKHYN